MGKSKNMWKIAAIVFILLIAAAITLSYFKTKRVNETWDKISKISGVDEEGEEDPTTVAVIRGEVMPVEDEQS